MFEVVVYKLKSFKRITLLAVLAASALFQMTNSAAEQVTVAWDANPEPDISDYLVYYGVVNNGTTNMVSAGTNTVQLVSELSAGTDYWFFVTARNSAGLESDPSIVLQHTTAAPPVAPTITSAAPPTDATVGSDYNHLATATGTSTISFTASGLPPGIAIAANGAISGTPTAAGVFSGEITASNGTLPDATQSFSIAVSEPLVAPILTSTPAPTSATVGTPYNHTVTATGSPTITFTAFGLPPGVSIAPTGVISGTPTSKGSFSGVITASNGTQPDATQSFSITVAEPVVAPTITSTPPPASATVGTPYNHTVAATGSSTITFSAFGLPPGVSIASGGIISGTPTTPGNFNGVITASNGTQPNAAQSFSIVVSAPEDPGDPPMVALGGDRLVIVPALVRPIAVATDDRLTPDQLTTTWTQISGPSVNIVDGDKLQPSIEIALPGNYTFRVTVDDGGNTASDEYQLDAYEGAEEPSPGSVVPNIQFVAQTFDGMILAWDSAPNKTYQIGYKEDLSEPSWLIVDEAVPSTGYTTYWVDDRGFPTSSGFFGIFEMPQ